jgi:hypothetical protein
MGSIKCNKCEEGYAYGSEFGDNYGHGIQYICEICGSILYEEYNTYEEWSK